MFHNHFVKKYHQMQETRKSCFRSKNLTRPFIRQKHMSKYNSNVGIVHCCHSKALVLKTIVANFLYLMAFFYKVTTRHTLKRYFLVLLCYSLFNNLYCFLFPKMFVKLIFIIFNMFFLLFLEDSDNYVRNAHSNNIYGLEETENTIETGDRKKSYIKIIIFILLRHYIIFLKIFATKSL